MALGKEQMALLYRNLVRADHFDKMMMNRIMQGKLIGFYHPGDGAMAAGVGASTFLGDNDILNPHHRAHGLAYAASRPLQLSLVLPGKKGVRRLGVHRLALLPGGGLGLGLQAQGQPDGADGLR
jgi:TPP-dependent pyruvate/acetoin dehydrogenase alpha subunit